MNLNYTIRNISGKHTALFIRLQSEGQFGQLRAVRRPMKTIGRPSFRLNSEKKISRLGANGPTQHSSDAAFDCHQHHHRYRHHHHRHSHTYTSISICFFVVTCSRYGTKGSLYEKTWENIYTKRRKCAVGTPGASKLMHYFYSTHVNPQTCKPSERHW